MRRAQPRKLISPSSRAFSELEVFILILMRSRPNMLLHFSSSGARRRRRTFFEDGRDDFKLAFSI